MTTETSTPAEVTPDASGEANNAPDRDPTIESWPLIVPPEPRSNVEADGSETKRYKKVAHGFVDFYHKYDFPIHVMIVILVAWLYPPLGATYVCPRITANYLAVCYIFMLFGLGVRTDEFGKAVTKVRFNAFIQCYNFGFISSVVFGVSRFLAWANILDKNLADGMAICSCLPMSINVGIVLTAAAGGDDAVAIFHTSLGNFVGVFLSPALILGYLGSISNIDIGEVYMHLFLIVIVPLIFGQLVQRLSRPIRDFYFQHKRKFKKSAECALVFIIFTIFSRKFDKGTGGDIGQVFIMIFFQLCLLVSFLEIMWLCLKYLYPDQPELRVTGTFIAVQKTIALGVPLITSIYGKSENLASYTLPIMVWHPMQLIVGSSLVPRMILFLAKERDRLAHKGGSDDEGSRGDVETPQLERGIQDDDVDVSSNAGSDRGRGDSSVRKAV